MPWHATIFCNHLAKLLQNQHIACHVGNNISETYPRRNWEGLNDASCILGSMLSSSAGLSNPAWVSLGNVVSHMDRMLLNAMMRCDVLLSWDAMVFCNNFMLPKTTIFDG